jgi:hypothetical protein
MKRWIALFALACVLPLAGCYRMHIQFDRGAQAPYYPPPAGVKAAKMNQTFVLGLWKLDQPVRLDAICSTGVAYVYQRLGGWSWVLAFLSGGVINARDILVVCKDGRRAHVHVKLVEK